MICESLKNRRIIITGASRGLGRVVARDLSMLGARLILIGRDIEKLTQVSKECLVNSECEILSIDLLDLKNIQKSIVNMLGDFSKIDGVIHIAGGGYGLREPMLKHDELTKLLNINLVSVVEINRILIPYFVNNGFGNIVHIGALAGSEAIASVGYGTSKAALSAYVRSIGNELVKYNIIASGISPGAFLSPGNSMDRLKKNNPAAYYEYIDKRIPSKKMCNSEELLPLIRLLLSTRSNIYSGSMISADGGEGVSYERV